MLRTLPSTPDHPGEAHRLAGFLSPAERERAARFTFDRDRWAYSAAHSLLRRTLTEFYGLPPLAWQFSLNAYGRPELDPAHHGSQAARFNISHTHGRVAVVTTLGIIPDGVEVGVDTEGVERTPDVLGLARRFLSASESDWLQALPTHDHQRQFLRLWTVKEAVAKAAGRGLSLGFQAFHCRFDPLSVQFDEAEWGTADEWTLYNEWVEPAHWVSVAVHCPPGVAVEWQVEHLKPSNSASVYP